MPRQSVGGQPARAAIAGELAARLDRIPATQSLWRLILTLSLGAAFEFYDLFFTAYVVPGMGASGLFKPESLGFLAKLPGAGGPGSFVFMTFMGLFIGALAFGWVADRFGRRSAFTYSMLWYCGATLILAFQQSGFWIDIWRMIAGIGLGVELVTIDTYLAELVPTEQRGRAFALNQVVSFSAVPVVALLAWLLVPTKPFGLDGWRWVVMIGALGALGVWFIRRSVPESPRWLARHGHLGQAETIVRALELRAEHDLGASLPRPAAVRPKVEEEGGFAAMFQPPYGRRVLLLVIFQLCQSVGFYGFQAWVPTLLIAKGIHVTTSLSYAFIIAIANPIGPLLGMQVADRIERKWQIVLSAMLVGVLGLLFAQQTIDTVVIALGVLLTLAVNWMSFAFHGYQAELFPTRIRARAVGFVYSWSRLSAAFTGLLIGFLLQASGADAVFIVIASAMLLIMVLIGVFGPRTLGRPLEEISP